jgi:hypothetical protein
MNDRFAPYDRCLRQPLWPESDTRSGDQMIPTGTPDEGCPIGTSNPSSKRWEPVRKRQKDHPYQVVQNILGHPMAYLEEWGSLEIGDPNRLGMYRLLIPDPTGTGSLADGVGPAGPVTGMER